MVINPSPQAIPVYTANLSTETVRQENRLLERIPEPKALAENVRLKPAADEQAATGRSERAVESKAENNPDRVANENQENAQGEKERDEPQEQPGSRKQRENLEQRQTELEIDRLQARDREVRAHESAHTAVGGQYAGIPNFLYQIGPDGKRYAIGGEVSIDFSVVPGNPEATIEKMRQIQRAATAPVDPSSQDRRVAAAASAKISEAYGQIRAERAELKAEAAQQKVEKESANDEAGEPVNAKERLEKRLSYLGVIESHHQGSRLNVTA